MSAGKDLLAKIEAKKCRISNTVEWLKDNASPSSIHSRAPDVERWISELDDIIDQLVLKSPHEERRKICLEAEQFSSEIREELLLLKANHVVKKPSTPLPLRMDLECPSFSGAPSDDKFEFRTFLRRFDFCTSNVEEADKLLLLKSKLKGKAYDLISSLDVTSDNYIIALNYLREKYLNPSLIKDRILEEIMPPTVPISNLEALKTYVEQVKMDLSELDKSFGTDFFTESSTSGIIIAHILFRKFPVSVRRELMSRTKERFPTFLAIMANFFDIIDFLQAAPLNVKKREYFAPNPSPFSSPEVKSDMGANSTDRTVKLKKGSNAPKLNDNAGYQHKFCKLCKLADHAVRDCTKYTSYDSRVLRAKELQLCIRCLGGHLEQECKGKRGFPYPCTTCGLKTHFSTMCPQTSKSFVGKTSFTDGENCLFPVIRVSLRAKGTPVGFHCILDTGSQKSFFSQAILQELRAREELVPRPVTMPVNTIIGTRPMNLQELDVSIKLGSQKPFPFTALFSDSLNLRLQVDRFDEITSNITEAGFRLCHGYRDLNGKELHGLVGLDLIQHLQNFRMVECINGTAWKMSNRVIPFGDGRNFLKPEITKTHNESPPFEQVCNSLPACSTYLVDSVLNPIPSYSDSLGPFFEESSVERGIEQFLSLDSVGINERAKLSSYDEAKIEEFKKTVLLKDGNYYVDLPWDYDKLAQVDSNYVPSLRIMQRVAVSLEKQGLYDKYLQVFDDYEKLGIVEPFSVTPGEYIKYCWIPHRPVFKEGLGVTTKIRPVFNCSLKKKGGVSINDAAYAGVNLTAQLLDLLLAFRKNNYVLLGDLRKAFLQIRLRTEQDKNRFCFFLKIKEKLCTYRYNSIIFGFNASPFILSYILKLHAERYDSDEFSSILTSNFYVDNLVTTGRDYESLLEVYTTVRKRLKEAGFDLQSCNSNCTDLQKQMIEDESITSPLPSLEKVLGYRYSPSLDTVRLSPVAVDAKANTKRAILSQISSLYDPLSLLLPVTVQGKVLVSQLWKDKLSWDQEIPETFTASWQALAKELNKLGDIEFPRRVLVDDCPMQLICFCDASKLAYGFSLYVRQGSQCSLLFAKAKVAPIKRKTLPTLELLAIYLALKVVPNVLKALGTINVNSFFLVSDAQVALSWVLNGKGNKNIFVENRVMDIKKMLDEFNLEFQVLPRFKYVPSSENPADLLTRGLTTSKFEQLLKFWVHGPNWLNQLAIDWPVSPLPCLNDVNKKVISCMFSDSPSTGVNYLPINIANYSSLTKAINVLEKVLRFCDKLKHRNTDTNHRAKLLLFSYMQGEEYPFELEYLRQPSNKAVPSRVSALGLFLDKDSLIRTRGRIQNSDIHPFDVKFPILLGKNHHLTELVIKEAHLNCCHLGTNSTLVKLRLSGFWIPQGRQSVKKILRNCIICKKVNSMPFKPPSGSQLPNHRANFIHPFQQVGVDFTGHFLVKQNDEDVKMYVLLFTCMSLRAVHLELLPDMSTTSFVLAFVRFTNQFGVPTHIYSDNAKTFLASGILLSEVFVSDEFKENFRSTTISHLTIPLYSAWHGGAWERMIKTLKQCLKKLLGRKKVCYFEFLTILSDVEKAINDRPLTYMTASEGGLDVLTPNHFLQTGYSPRLLISSQGSDELCPDPPVVQNFCSL